RPAGRDRGRTRARRRRTDAARGACGRPAMTSKNGSFRALIVEHERATPGGLIYDWLEDQGAEIDELRIDVEEREVDPAGYDLIVPLGSEFAAYDDSIQWIPREIELLRKAHEAGAVVLGICFGGQLRARTLG